MSKSQRIEKRINRIEDKFKKKVAKGKKGTDMDIELHERRIQALRDKSPLNFGVSGIFGRMGQNPSINALTNANALAQQQLAQQNIQPLGSGTTYRPDMSQQVMTGSFDPLTQQVGMGIFGDQNARNMAVRGSGLMMHGDKLRDRAKKLSEGSEQGDYDYDNPKVVKLLEKARKADESHKDSPAKNRGETYEEFKKRTGKTSMKAYMRDNPKGSKK